MKIMDKKNIILALFIFISWQSAYSQGFGGLTSGISQKLGNISKGIKQYGSKKIDNFGAMIKIESIKSKTGDFVGEHTHSSIGGKVTASRWRDAATVSGFRKAVGIVAGTAHGALGGKQGDAVNTSMKMGNLKTKDLAEGVLHHFPDSDQIVIKIPYKSSLSDFGEKTYFFSVDNGTIKAGVPSGEAFKYQ